jgi:PAN domain-containing protein
MWTIARPLSVAAALCFAFISTGPALAAAPSLQVDVDMPGFDYGNFDLPKPSARLCQEACFNDERCRAWTFVHPAIYGARSACWLKSRVPEAQPNRCCISGTRE